MRTLKYTAIFISIFIFIVWANYFNIFLPFEIFFPKFHILFLTLVIIISIASRYIKFLKIPDINLRPFILFPVIGFISALLVNIIFFKSIPHIQDSIHYQSIAQNLLKGQLHHPFIENHEFFAYLYMIPDGEKIYSLFLPGYSVFLMPFVALGTSFLANPILTALNIFTIGKIAEKLFDRQVAVLTMITASLSSFFIIMGGTYMAHPFCTLLTLSTVYCFIKTTEKNSWRYPLIVGTATGWLVLIRPQNALFLFLPLFLYTSYLIIFKKNFNLIKKLSVAAIVFLPFLMILFWINYHYTGNILIFKQDLFFNYSEPTDFCHRFGIGTGCHNSNWIDLPREGLTWGHAFLVSFRRLSPLTLQFFLHPLSFIFIISSFFFAKNKRELFGLLSLFGIFLFTFGGYFFFYFDGNVFGPRYLYEASFFLIIIFAFGLRSVINLKIESEKEITQVIKILTFAFFAAAFIFHTFVTYPKLRSAYSDSFWDVDSRLHKAVEKKGLHNAVIFVYPEVFIGSGLAVMDMGDIENNDVIYVRDLGPKQNSRLMFDYPDRSFYVAIFGKYTLNKNPLEIKPLEKIRDVGEYHVEMEDKNYPLTGNPDYCNFFPKKKYIDTFLDFDPPYSQVKRYQRFYFCRFTEKSQYYDFGQKVNYSGKYKLSIKVMKGPNMGSFNFLVDDKPVAELKTHSEKIENDTITFEIDLEKGFRKFRIEPSSSSFPYYFFIDYIDFYLLTREALTMKDNWKKLLISQQLESSNRSAEFLRTDPSDRNVSLR